MSVSPTGGDAFQRWQSLRESRASPSADGSAATRPRPPRGPPSGASGPSATGSVDASGNPGGSGSIGGTSAKVISDLKALFIDLQSAATGGGSGAPSVQSDLKTLSGDLDKAGGATVGGYGGGHHRHQPPPAGPGADAATVATAGQPATKPAGGLLDALVGALKAYTAPADDSSVRAPTTLIA